MSPAEGPSDRRGRGTPRPVHEAVSLAAPAKVNLHLRILEREPSGYHRIETLFQAVALEDRVQVEPGGRGITLEVDGPEPGPPGENLVVRAAEAYRAAAGVGGGLRIRLVKRIPAGAGLGGGSSDAAATLLALNHLFGGLLPHADLLGLAAALGSDVPFFLCGSPLAEGRGRGEVLRALPPLPEAPLLLALPPVHVSTAAAYGALDAVREGEGSGVGTGPAGKDPGAPSPGEGSFAFWEGVATRAANDFEAVVGRRHPRVARALAALRGTDPPPAFALLAGSGGACFAVYASEVDARAALSLLEAGDGAPDVVLTRTLVAMPTPEAPPGLRSVQAV